jgi:hypothetical protein
MFAASTTLSDISTTSKRILKERVTQWVGTFRYTHQAMRVQTTHKQLSNIPRARQPRLEISSGVDRSNTLIEVNSPVQWRLGKCTFGVAINFRKDT